MQQLLSATGSGDINLSRARHAEEMREKVDVEMILADTIRIKTDDAVINSTRAGIISHGAQNVKLIATKIDVSVMKLLRVMIAD